ncbi:hypothetical protein V1460_26390 [Streptomyces sp. SCSIO 30461]|uniref:hypothetical protein n=1 Tax=Streptomyces sp. SCSIO 30461 TaxID=3118085 RepID=UPI0030CC9EF1
MSGWRQRRGDIGTGERSQAPAWIADHGDIAINQSARRFRDPRVGRAMDAHVITEAHHSYGLTLQRATFVLRERAADAKAESVEQLGLFDVDGPDLPVH